MRFVLVMSLLLPDTDRVPVTHLIQDLWVRSCSGALAEDPRVVHDLIAVHARIRIHNKQLADEVLGLAGDSLPGRRAEVVLA